MLCEHVVEMMMSVFHFFGCGEQVGARCHGGDGLWLAAATEGFGFNQVHATADAYVDAAAFDATPSEVCLMPHPTSPHASTPALTSSIDLISDHDDLVRSNHNLFLSMFVRNAVSCSLRIVEHTSL